MDGFSCSNAALTARSYRAGDKLAVDVTNTGEKPQKGTIEVPGYRFTEGRNLDFTPLSSPTVNLKQHDLVVLVYEKE